MRPPETGENSRSGYSLLQNLLIVATIIGILLFALLLAQTDRTAQLLANLAPSAEADDGPVNNPRPSPSPTNTAPAPTPRIMPTGTIAELDAATATPSTEPVSTAAAAASAAAATPTSFAEPSAPPPTADPTSTAANPTAAPCMVTVPRGWTAYVVRMGDTLFSLSRRAGVSQRTVMNVNCILRQDRIYAGYIIYLPPLPTFTPTATNVPPTAPPPPPPTQTPLPPPTRQPVPTATFTPPPTPTDTPVPYP